jgi:hypothetical protein
MRSCSLSVFVYETTEEIASADSGRPAHPGDRWSNGWIGRLQPERPVRTVGVVVLDVDPQHLLEVAAPDDQQPVQALGPHRPDPALGVGVGVRRLHRRDQHLGALGAAHVVEAAGELRVAVAQHKAQLSSSFAEHQQQVAGLLVTHRPLGAAVTPARWTRRVSSLMKNSTYSRRNQMVLTVKKSHAMIPAACWRRNARQVVAIGRGAGSSPLRRRVLRIADAETRTLRCSSSPWMRW